MSTTVTLNLFVWVCVLVVFIVVAVRGDNRLATVIAGTAVVISTWAFITAIRTDAYRRR